MSDYKELLKLVEKNTVLFEDLAGIQQVKLDAAIDRDTAALEECMKKEQAATLALRGFDKRRIELQEKLSLGGKTFHDLIPLVPEEFQADYTAMYQRLTEAYQTYQTTAASAKDMIEVNIYKIGLAINRIREQANLPNTDTYAPDGSKSVDTLNLKDMKI